VNNHSTLLKAYRALAYITGVGLILLCAFCVSWYGFGVGSSGVMIVGTIHGWAFMAYAATAFTLGMKLKWSNRKLIAILLAGTIPTCSFIAERRVMRDIEAQIAGKPATEPVRA
jgi:integral membrane protein